MIYSAHARGELTPPHGIGHDRCGSRQRAPPPSWRSSARVPPRSGPEGHRLRRSSCFRPVPPRRSSGGCRRAPATRSPARRRGSTRRPRAPARPCPRPGQLVDAEPLSRAVVLDAAAVHPPGQDVDAQHLVATGIPADAFAEAGRRSRTGHSDAVSRTLPGAHRQPPKSTTTLMSSGPRVSASVMWSGGTRREISRPSQSRSAAARTWAPR